MLSLKTILSKKGFVSVKLTKTSTNHFEVKAKINGVKGRFIVDTGASNSCVGLDMIKHFKLEATDSKVKAAGAGSSEMDTQLSSKNIIEIGDWQYKNFDLVLFDLSHVNTALKNHGAKTVEGIIGADILEKGEAIIDYKKKRLYLKKLIFKF
ncbi:retropepsin-like aspartic protease family protein [Urechidicola croceus]|uniref:Acid protease n=1 Tax=Urechidicola croceus TaxID=1850246 RepID=A0A1D8PA16_9FLAO|nr:retropepsin-like aspartic protease [Urechidicola croceus]AOW21403.1 acid protease [Urechidicola croceus]